ncbi:disulfide bond formation protein B [Flexibacterium corallicola]|uniref:disulfide bond formation protein B n=1 Tax=Flexibacterium corallicola TaxID=3037259 RepID=UPI00286EC9B2|nr:disulfide bond formation protein B [Pseudovibrio sp. M1P-2-3]
MSTLSSPMKGLMRNFRSTGAVLVFLGCIVAITMAWGFEILGGYVPCKLCLAQRNPYYIGLIISLLAFLCAQTTKFGWVGSLLLLLAAGLFVYGGGIGIYQAGAEWGFWLGPNDCGGGGDIQLSASNMMQALSNERIVSCSNAALRILGLSFAGWNVIYSTGIAFIALCGAILGGRSLKR